MQTVREGGGPVRGRHLGRTVGLLLILAALIAGTTVALAGRSLPVLSSLGRVGGGGEAGHPPNGPVAISSPKGTIAAVPRTTSGDTLAAAQAIVAPAVAPQRLLVPVIGVNAPVESVGLDAKGRMATPSRCLPDRCTSASMQSRGSLSSPARIRARYWFTASTTTAR